MKSSLEPDLKRLARNAGIAIGPILFVIAVLAMLALVMASNIGEFGTASVADRISADLPSQANLIRAKINECNLRYGTNNNYDGYPSSNTSTGDLVSNLNCSGDPSGQQNLWSGLRTTFLPQPTSGFDSWHYINTDANTGSGWVGGICIWTAPTSSNPSTNAAIVAGLTKAASKFSHSTSYSSAAEVIYDPASSSQKFIVWIKLPTGTANSNCLP